MFLALTRTKQKRHCRVTRDGRHATFRRIDPRHLECPTHERELSAGLHGWSEIVRIA
jgi:hypothetical protein